MVSREMDWEGGMNEKIPVKTIMKRRLRKWVITAGISITCLGAWLCAHFWRDMVSSPLEFYVLEEASYSYKREAAKKLYSSFGWSGAYDPDSRMPLAQRTVEHFANISLLFCVLLP